ncbi:MAG: hypothetical protein CL886_08325 [Dehalococcoidia bacterium]|nr:hypothetical protein [Dehalococcoidia bacterium]
MVDKRSTSNKIALDRAEKLETLFYDQIDQGLHPGAALAVYYQGSLVVDLYGGLADRESGKRVSSDTMFVLYSCTKPLTATCIYILWERGLLHWDDPVAKYWPAFSKNGKEEITIRHVLTHQGGFPKTPPSLTWNKWEDWDFVTRVLSEVTPKYKPGEVMAYHPRNFGWVLGEVIRRVDGRSIDRFMSEEIFLPLGMDDSYLGLPRGLGDRVSRVHAMEDCDRAGAIPIYNQPEVHRSVQPSGGGISTARDLARFYSMLNGDSLCEGVNLLSPETILEVTRIHAEGTDLSLGGYRMRGLGLVIGDSRMGCTGRSDESSFGHAGAGTSVAWSDPVSGLSCAFITNGFRAEDTNVPRLHAISKSVRSLSTS